VVPRVGARGVWAGLRRRRPIPQAAALAASTAVAAAGRGILAGTEPVRRGSLSRRGRYLTSGAGAERIAETDPASLECQFRLDRALWRSTRLD
jgi:hypothetical protein